MKTPTILGWPASALALLTLTASCGGDDEVKCSLSVWKINDGLATETATISNGDDVSEDLPGVQVDVLVDAIGLSDGTTVDLQVEGRASSQAEVSEGQASFAAVDLGTDDGAVTLSPSLPDGRSCSILSRNVVLTTIRCSLIAPIDDEILNGADDLDAATPNTLETEVRIATNAPDGSTASLVVAGEPAVGVATVSELTAVFPRATLPDRVDVPIEVHVTTPDGGQATCGVTVDVDLGFDSCAVSVPAAEPLPNLGLTVNGLDDQDPASGVQTDVVVTTDAPAGATAELTANEQLLATTDFVEGEATFASQSLPEGTLVLRATCRDSFGNELRSPPLLVTVDSVPPDAVVDLSCDVTDRRTAILSCAWTAPNESGTGLGAYDLRYMSGGVDIDAANFASAIVATPAVAPVPSGARQVYDLVSDADNVIRIGSTYDLAVVALDAAGNASGLSNDTPPLTPWFNEQSLEGEDANGYFGLSAAAGDFNCDGVGDLAVGAPDLSGGSVASPNRVYLYFGGPRGLPDYYDVRILSTQGSNFGSGLATLGNFDEDSQGPAGGCDDLAVGASLGQRVYVYLGRPAWFDRTDEDTGTGAEVVFNGEYAGWSGRVAGGDFDGSGSGDLFYGVIEPFAVPPRPARVIGILGFAATPMGPGIVPLSLSATADADVTINSTDLETFGGFLSTGDVNGDGFDDVLIGQYGYDVTPGDDVGAIHIVYGGASPPATIDIDDPSAPASLVTGGPNNLNFGWAVNAVGDLDDDGGLELAVGDLSYSIPDVSAGIAYVFTGLEVGVDQTVDDAVWTISNATGTPDSESDFFGRAFVPGGPRLDDDQLDVEGDGYADLVVAETEHGAGVGSVLIYLGGPAGPVGTTNDAADIRLAAPAGASGGFGAALVSVGQPDFNYDGFGDFAVTDATFGTCGGAGVCGRLTVYW